MKPSTLEAPTPALAAPSPADLALLKTRADDAATLLRALANSDRLLLLCALVDGERNVGDLEAATGIRQPSLSQQLGVLREEQLVATRREGKYIHYSIASPAALQVLQTLYRLFCAPDAPQAPAARSPAARARRVTKELT